MTAQRCENAPLIGDLLPMGLAEQLVDDGVVRVGSVVFAPVQTVIVG